MEDSGDLIYQGHKSSEFGIKITFPFTLVHPVPDLTPTHIKGRSGDFLQHDGSYQNVTQTFDIFVNRPLNYSNQADWDRAVTSWLKPRIDSNRRVKYEWLKFSYDPEYVFSATIQNPYTVTWNSVNEFVGTGNIPFYCEPFQYRIDGITYQDLPQLGAVYNTENEPAIPDWHFVANGTFTLNVNGLEYQFENMEGEFWVSGDTSDTYDKNNKLFNNQVHFPNLIAPILPPGQNTITITAETGTTITKAEYKPKWRRLI